MHVALFIIFHSFRFGVIVSCYDDLTQTTVMHRWNTQISECKYEKYVENKIQLKRISLFASSAKMA